MNEFLEIQIKTENNLPPFSEINSTINLSIIGITKSGSEIDITNDSNTKIVSLDQNFILVESNLVSFRKEGTAIIKAFYVQGNLVLESTKEFICYNNFFKTNYLRHFIPVFDSNIIKANTKLKIMLDSIMTYLDIIYAYKFDIKSIQDINITKSKYLEYIGTNLGFQRNNNSFDANEVDVYNELYRELLKNLVDLIKLRGTKLAYELFFGALGYDIVVDEFWWNDNNQLIQIDDFALDDEEFPINHPLQGRKKSTFYAYLTDSTPVGNQEIAFPDPRRFADYKNPITKNAKSNYVRPLLFTRDNSIVQNVGSLSFGKRSAIFEYLDYLKPGYINYLPLVVQFSGAEEILQDLEDNFKIVLFNSLLFEEIIDELDLDEILFGGVKTIEHYIDSNSLFYDISGIFYDSGYYYDSYALFKEQVGVQIL
jgi:hypothetical protein